MSSLPNSKLLAWSGEARSCNNEVGESGVWFCHGDNAAASQSALPAIAQSKQAVLSCRGLRYSGYLNGVLIKKTGSY